MLLLQDHGKNFKTETELQPETRNKYICTDLLISQDDADLIKDCQKYLYNMYVMFSTSFELDTLKFFPLEFLLDQLIKIIIYLKVQT